ncbi:MAG: hypothetical protein LC700_03490 [Actinobacteria bacterium]|nr:hypothetical protein [Actinomycetota bacterium]
MNAKRISARLIVATMTAGAAMSMAAPAWADMDNEQSELLDTNSDVQKPEGDSGCALQASEVSDECSVLVPDLGLVGLLS